jgi:hypothetical protein
VLGVRLVGVVMAVAGVLGLAGCGDDVAEGPPVLTGQALGDSLALAAKADLEERGFFGITVGDQGGRCRGREAHWSCTVQIIVTETGRIRDRRTYDMRVKVDDGCWTARQTGTDVGETGVPRQPSKPGVLKGCLE